MRAARSKVGVGVGRGGFARVVGAAALAVAIGAGVLVGGASPAASAPPVRYLDPVFADVAVTHDLTYGQAVNAAGVLQSLELDLYEPVGDPELRRPVFIWAHGGFFTQGNKSEIGTIAPFLAQRGYVVLSIEYRLNPALPQGLAGYAASEQLPYDLALLVETIRDGQHDLQAAVRWARANGSARRLDPDRIATGGFSAGATMSIAAAYNSDDPGDSGNPGYPSHVTAAIGTGTLNIPLIDIHPDPLVEPPVAMFHGAQDESPYLGPLATCLVAVVMLNVCEARSYAGEGHSSRNGIGDWPAFLNTWVVGKKAPPLRLPQGLLPLLPALRFPSALVPKNLLPDPSDPPTPAGLRLMLARVALGCALLAACLVVGATVDRQRRSGRPFVRAAATKVHQVVGVIAVAVVVLLAATALRLLFG